MSVVQKQEWLTPVFTSPCSAPLKVFSISTGSDDAQQPCSPSTLRRANAIARPSAPVCAGCKMAAESEVYRFIIYEEVELQKRLEFGMTGNNHTDKLISKEQPNMQTY